MNETIKRVRLTSLLREANDRVSKWYWIKCDLCLGHTTFEDIDDLFEFQKRGFCVCGHPFKQRMATGLFPKGKLFIWDEQKEPE